MTKYLETTWTDTSSIPAIGATVRVRDDGVATVVIRAGQSGVINIDISDIRVLEALRGVIDRTLEISRTPPTETRGGRDE